MTERLFTAYQVAAKLGVTPGEVAQWVRSGKLNFQRAGDGPPRIRERDLLGFLRQLGVDLAGLAAEAPGGNGDGPEVKITSSRPVDLEPDREAAAGPEHTMRPAAHAPIVPAMAEAEGRYIPTPAAEPAPAGPAPVDPAEDEEQSIPVEVLGEVPADVPPVETRPAAISTWRPLDQLGLSAGDLAVLRRSARRGSGLIVVAGPPRSGRATTLRALACAGALPRGRQALVVERTRHTPLDGLAQLYCGKELSFEKALAAALAQGVDVVLLDEVRRADSLREALAAALEGQLVIAAVQARSAGTALGLLLEAGADRWDLATGLLAVISQRLARANCPHCRRRAPADPQLLEQLGLSSASAGQDIRNMKAAGCDRCGRTGISGATGIFSVLSIDAVATQLRAGADIATIESSATAAGHKSLLQSGLEKVCQGDISLEELTWALDA